MRWLCRYSECEMVFGMKSPLLCSIHSIYTTLRHSREFERITPCFQDFLKIGETRRSGMGICCCLIQDESHMIHTFAEKRLSC